MTGPTYGDSYSENAAENYERYFVPAIGRPVAAALVAAAALAPGERVLDVACGTGIVARLAAERVPAPGAHRRGQRQERRCLHHQRTDPPSTPG